MVIHQSNGINISIALSDIHKITFDLSNTDSKKPFVFKRIKAVLSNFYPSPFKAHIKYSLPNQANIQAFVLSINGKIIRSFSCGNQNAGSYSLDWNGRDDFGFKMPKGTYVVIVRADKKAILTNLSARF
jgi:hypothetical protein